MQIKIKLLAACLLCQLCLFICLAAPAQASQLPIILDGVNISLEPSSPYEVSSLSPTYAYERLAQEQDGVAYVPLRTISELSGAKVTWYPPRQIAIYHPATGKNIALTPGSPEFYLDGETIKLNAAPYVQNDLTFVPLRFIAETFGYVVYYHDGVVSLATEPFTIGDVPVTSLELANPWHVIGSDYYQISGAQMQRSLYNALRTLQGGEAPAPETVYRSWMASQGDYYWGEGFCFSAADSSVLYDVQLIYQSNSDSTAQKNAVMLYDHRTKTYHTIPQEQWRQAQPIIERNLQFKQFTYSDAP